MALRTNIIIAVVACALFMENLDSTIMVTALPQIAVTFHSNPLRLSLAVTGYIVSFAVFILVGGWLADRIGSGTVFRAAILVFTASSIWCGLSNGVAELILARICQGVGAAMMVPVGRTVVLRVFDKSQMVQAMAMVSLPALIGPLLGAPVGGFITTYLSWRWNFFINVPVGVVGLVLASLYVPNIREGETTKFDWIGFFLTGITVGLVVYALAVVERGTGSLGLAGLFLAGGGLFGVVSVWHSRRIEAPLLDLSLLRVQTFRVATTGSMGSRIGTGATPYLLPLLFQVGFDRSPFQSGLLTFATAVGIVAMRPWSKPILRRFGFRAVLVRNGAFTGISIFLCAFFAPSTPAAIILGVLMVGGFFRAVGISTVNTLAYVDIDGPKMSSAASFAMMVNQLGNAFGVAAGATILHLSMAWRGAAQLGLTDFKVAFIGAGAVAALSLPIFAGLSADAGAEVSGHRLRVAKPSAGEGGDSAE